LENKLTQKIINAGLSLFSEPLTFKKALLLCFYLIGLYYSAQFLAYWFNLSTGIIPGLIFLAAIIFIAAGMGKDELNKILVWRNIPIAVFAGVMILFFGFNILRSELRNLFQILLPLPDGFFNAGYPATNIIFIIISTGLFPGFSEEIFFRGIIARRFFRIYSPVKSILLSAVLFGMLHLNPWQAVNAFIGGIFYGWVYWRYRSIWLCMFTHAYSNILAVLMPLPFKNSFNNYYEETWHHPAWLIILGAALFVLGLLIVIALSRKEKTN